ncbi:MAG TPA: hypothetical protein VEB20_18245 [Azospirillaceae bacterium]|nr:hypothetical protein [Azospirillaceae bacterium]
MFRSFCSALLMTLATAMPAHAADPADVLLKADRDFAAKAQEIGVGKAFALYAAETVYMINSPEPKGPGAALEKGFPPDLQMDWAPEYAQIAASGDLGWTWGRATRRFKDKEGKLVEKNSQYMTVWHKQADGSWKFVADMGADVGPGKPLPPAKP